MFQFFSPSFTHDKGTYIQTKIYGSKPKTYLLCSDFCIMVFAGYFRLWRLKICSYSFYLRSVGTIHSSVKWLNPFFLRSQRCCQPSCQVCIWRPFNMGWKFWWYCDVATAAPPPPPAAETFPWPVLSLLQSRDTLRIRDSKLFLHWFYDPGIFKILSC